MLIHRYATKTAGSIITRCMCAALLIALPCLRNVAVSQQSTKKAAPGAESSVRQVFSQMVDAAQKRDDKAIARFHSTDATFIDGSGFSKGFESHQMKAVQKVGVNAPHADLTDFKVADVTDKTVGDVAWVTYKYSLTAPVNGKPTPIVGVSTIIFQRIGKEWKVVHSQTTGRPRTESDKPL